MTAALRHALVAAAGIAACVSAAAFDTAVPRAPAAAGDAGRFVWRDLMTRDVRAAKRFYGELLGWRFENARRGELPYVLARAGTTPVGGIVDVTSLAGAGEQWLSFMAVDNVDRTVSLVESGGGRVLVAPREASVARVAVVTDPQGAPLGLAQLRREIPDPAQPAASHFFWQEYLARDAEQALAFYKGLATYESAVLETRLGVDYHVLRTTRGRAGLFRIPPSAVDVQPNWLPYVLVENPAALAARVQGLGGRIVVPAAPERRNGSLVVIADPGGAVLALQKFPF
ncbi:MAG TPA: VOC family protein [Vicinamibacterales bacterium]|nr:VOC family protein [Vicinamibacterales bacterium]